MPIVGLGGSAGSMTALKQFFSAMPADSGMAFVVIVHLSAEHESFLATLLQQTTALRVVVAADGIRVAPNCVYVIPPGKQLVCVDGSLGLVALRHDHGRRVTIDLFFRTLADTHGSNCAAIVLSGADGDGAMGIKRVKERGGLTIAQEPGDAEHSGMPRAAIETGMVDLVMKAGEIPGRLVAYWKQGQHLVLPAESDSLPPSIPEPPAAAESALRDILAFLHSRTGRDFSYYKRATILRRLARRMQINCVETMPAYLELLRATPAEAGALLNEFLVSVTNFFRDREAFAALEGRLPPLFKGKASADFVRVWCAACATGEEAYSLAILLDECARTLSRPVKIQIFATDLAEDAIQTAREGLYPEAIGADVSEDRLLRYFIKEHHGYRVRRELRETILFAHHDLLRDSPFSRLDLIACRNLLIYLNRDAQMRAFDIFNFALRPDGLLFLGSSESAEDAEEAFAVLDKRNRIYVAKPSLRSAFPVPRGPSATLHALTDSGAGRPKAGAVGGAETTALAVAAGSRGPAFASWSEMHFQLLEQISPPSVLINQEHEIVHVSPTAGRFLQVSGGEPTRNLLRAVDPVMRVALRAALFRAAQSPASAETFHVQLDLDGMKAGVEVRVSAASRAAQNFFVVVFNVREKSPREANPAEKIVEPEGVMHELERENETLKSNLRDVMHQSEASNEELKASNEELQAMNEEMRSASEELETSREELQSINEELTTVNHELKHKVDELGRANSDLQNLMAATSIATVFLDRELRITRYTPSAVTLFHFIPTDIGRPFSDLTRQRDYWQIEEDAARALSHLTPAQRELQFDGRWFLARTLPYRTIDDRIAGVVVTFFDITERKQAEEVLQAAGEELNTRVKQRTADLAKANELLRAEVSERVRAQEAREDMVRRLMVAQEDERSRISRGLHDEVGQTLASLLLDLKAIQTAPNLAAASSHAKAMAGIVEKLSRQTHELAVELRPTALDDLGLERALANYVERWSARTGIAAEFTSSGLENSRLPAAVETNLYRIVTEALGNVRKHAKATKVSVVLQRKPGQVAAVIEDNGVGFDADAKRAGGSLGILGMRERAALQMGELIIESTPGEGTTVHVRVPIDRQLADDALR